jgi:L,D-peptidoglycan transpeptidase YkuD (ErfK/YbiS/YcfS/YnhG family)
MQGLAHRQVFCENAAMKNALRLIRVHRAPLAKDRGLILAGQMVFRCALGRSGCRIGKREGDGRTPRATLRVLALHYRPDRGPPPRTRLKSMQIKPDQGWCDAPDHRRYNQPVPLPFAAGHEKLWREDGLYDVVLDLDWNRRPAIKGRGSAIFLHLARPGDAPTEGCIAVSRASMTRLLGMIDKGTRFRVG